MAAKHRYTVWYELPNGRTGRVEIESPQPLSWIDGTVAPVQAALSDRLNRRVEIVAYKGGWFR